MRELVVNSKKYGTVVSWVDDEKFEYLSQFNWNVSESKGNLYLTARQVYPDDKLRRVKLHQLVMWPYDSIKYVIDHKDRNTLNNTKENLRLATWAENTQNRRPQSNKAVPYKGVHKGYKCYKAQIMIGGKRIIFNGFKTPEEAARKYNELARIHHGEFAYQNPV